MLFRSAGAEAVSAVIREVRFAQDEQSGNRALQIVIDPQSTHRVVHGRINSHRDVVRILGSDLLIHVEEIAVLGAAFKPDSDDVRDSPALDIASQIHSAGADVMVHDPKAMENARARFPRLGFAQSIEECLKDADLVLHLTEWKEYRALDPVAVKKLVKNAIIIDGRNHLDREKWLAAGWKFRALGRTHHD